MASLRKKERSPYWFACFYRPDGRRTQRSTGVPFSGVRKDALPELQRLLAKTLDAKVSIPKSADKGLDARAARRLAQSIAGHFEEVGREARKRELTTNRARSVIDEIHRMVNKDALPTSTIRGYCKTWLAQKELEVSSGTHSRYSTVIGDMLIHLGARANRDLTTLTMKDIVDFRESLSKRLSISTVNISIKIARMVLTKAKRDGLVSLNVAENVSMLKLSARSQSGRRPLTLDEMKRVLAVADDEWHGMILVGMYTGIRLGDVASLSWANLDLQQSELCLTTAKTGRRMVIPLAEPLHRHLLTLPAGDAPNAPLFPRAAGTRDRTGRTGSLSNEFHSLLVSAGLATARTHASTGKGRSSKRETGGLSFHCLRHTATSLLKNAGVSDAVARDIIGHESVAISRNYTHIDGEAKRSAVAKLPDVTATDR